MRVLIDVKSSYYRDVAGRLFMLQVDERTPRTWTNPRIRLDLHRLGKRGAPRPDANAAGTVARLDCFIEPLDADTAACLLDLWLGANQRTRATIDLMLGECEREIVARHGRKTLFGIAVLDLGDKPQDGTGPRRYGHFTARPDGFDSGSIWPHMDDDQDPPAESAFTEVGRPDTPPF
jgi:hypothetical protein